MRATIALHWKNLIDTIHPPLPLTKHQSNQILKTLNTSFQSQLDSHHPIKEAHPSSHHVSAVLGNPLFAQRPVVLKKRRSGTKTESSLKTSSIRERVQAEPLAVLHDAISEGTFNPTILKHCLSAQLKSCESSLDVRNSIQKSGAGKVVLQWLWASGNSRTLQHLGDASLSRLIIKFLVAEHKHDHVLQWIRADDEVLESLFTFYSPHALPGRTLLELVKAESSLGAGLQSALEIFYRYTSDLHRSTITGSMNKKRMRVLRPTGNYLMESIRNGITKDEVKPADYDVFSAKAKMWARENGFELAWLALHHPEHPDANPTLSYLRSLTLSSTSTLPPTSRTSTVELAIKAAEMLLAEGRQTDAVIIVDTVKQHFPTIVGVSNERDIVEAEDDGTPEFSNIHLLRRMTAG